MRIVTALLLIVDSSIQNTKITKRKRGRVRDALPALKQN
jgi:hypothetical protein